MAIPILVGAAVGIMGLFGAKKGYDAHNKNKEAKQIVQNAQNRFSEMEEKLKREGELLNKNFEDFATFKLVVFTTQIQNLIGLLKKCKDKASSNLNHENINLTPEEIKQLENTVSNSLEITSGLAKGLQSGTLTAFGAYGGVGLLASASTGTAISTLSGAAATNATLAWLGGGSLAAGGGGMALGTAVLGGIVAGPLIAVTGFVMDSKAEQNLTDAYDYEAEIDINIEKMKLSIEGFKVISSRIDELTNIINELTVRFDSTLRLIEDVSFFEKFKRLLGFSKICELQELDHLILIGKNLKIALDIPLLDADGNENENFRKEIKRITIS